MHIKSNKPGRRTLIIREIDGDRLESPITVEFSSFGVANVSDGVGEYLMERYMGISEIVEAEEDHDSYPQEG